MLHAGPLFSVCGRMKEVFPEGSTYNRMVRGLGTLINAAAIIASGVLGVTFRKFIKESYQETMLKATGFAVMFMGAAGSLSKLIII